MGEVYDLSETLAVDGEWAEWDLKPIRRERADLIAPGTAPGPSLCFLSAMRRSTQSRNVPVPTAGSAKVTWGDARPA